MKQVSVLKKPSKSWALIKNIATGHFLTGYIGDHAVHGTYAKVRHDLNEVDAYLLKTPKPPVLREAPSWHFERAAYQVWEVEKLAYNEYQRAIRKQGHEVYSYMPIFEEDLIFTGYSKGQSSFTLDFIAQNGQKLSFGPSCTGQLIDSIVQQRSPIVDMTGKQGVSTGHPYLGNGVRVRFTFVKQGQNIYAQVTEE